MSKNAEKRLRIGIVGAGYVSRHHISALRGVAGVDIVGIADVNVESAQTMASKYSVPVAVARLGELAECRPDAVYILTPPSTHCALALEALDLGCHVFVEKPMAETVAECDAMMAKAAERGLTLAVNHSDRLDPIVLAALEKVRNGVCGDLVAVDFIRGSDYAAYAGGKRYGPYAKGSYPFQDIGVHGLYLLEAFLGEIESLRVDYRSIANDPYFLFDDWRADAKCQKGFGRLHLSWVARPMQNRLIIQGTRGYIEIDRFLQTMSVNRSLPGPKFIGMVLNALLGAVRRGFSVCWNVLRFATKRLPPSPGIYAGAVDFASALLDGRAPAVSAEEGRRVVALMEPVSREADAAAERLFAARFKPLEPAEYLITGASGFVGGTLLRRLVEEHKTVRVLLRRPVDWISRLPGVQIVIGDLGDPEIVDHAVDGVNAVYHVGAAMRGSAESFRSGTTVGVRNVIDSCLRHGVERLIYVSSMSVMQHAGRRGDEVLREDSAYEHHPELRGLYTQTKLDAERAVLDAIASHGLRAVVLRPGQIFGPGAEYTPPNGVIALAGRWVLVGNGTLPLPLVFIDDVIDALRLAASGKEVVGKVFNLVDTAEVTQNEYLGACKLAGGQAVKLIRVPKRVMLMLAWGVELLGKVLRRGVPLTPYRVESLRPLSNFDITAAQEILHWTPSIGSRDGLRRTFEHKPSGK